MGRKLGNALIIYGVINAFICLFLGPAIAIGGIIWLIILVALGKWQRDKAQNERLQKLEEQRETVNVNLTNQIANQQQDRLTYDALANAVNKILDEREKSKTDIEKFK